MRAKNRFRFHFLALARLRLVGSTGQLAGYLCASRSKQLWLCPAGRAARGTAIDNLPEMNEHSFMALTAARRMPALADRPDKADRRDAILRAAIETFAARGFFNAQVADVARAAGVAAGTVYLYFRGKDDLLISIFERTMKEAIAAGRDSVSAKATPLERLREIAKLHLGRLGRDRNLAIVFQIELRQSTKFMERFSAGPLREYLGIIRDVIAEGQAKGVFRKQINPTLAAKVFFGALDEMATNWILSRRKYSLASEADSVVDLFVGGLGRGQHREP
jgi:TetR/AcrR family fatty acid metabolism transcriptional regulator